ncbi:hypothetical protein WMY93_012597 [Mugilogobius chulae]|uniref:Uncharacterized protein n=1 Tax=Mugilogobius chulae TaxID=88201 RepID=A0AAW0P414_9GOBI
METNACWMQVRRSGFHADTVSVAASGSLDKTDSSGCGSSASLEDFEEQDVLVGKGPMSEAEDFSVAALLTGAAAAEGLSALSSLPNASALKSLARPREAILSHSALCCHHPGAGWNPAGWTFFWSLGCASPSGRADRHLNKKNRVTDVFVVKAYESTAMAAGLANKTALVLVLELDEAQKMRMCSQSMRRQVLNQPRTDVVVLRRDKSRSFLSFQSRRQASTSTTKLMLVLRSDLPEGPVQLT